MKKRTIELVMAPPAPHWVGDGFHVHNFIPSGYRLDMERMSPFILLDYNAPYVFPPSERPLGVGVHPHRGFETVTLAYKGRVEHHDSHGGGGIIGEGDVQWMTAAAGILHKEYHEKEWSRRGGVFQMVQLWVNLPAEKKMSRPKYQAVTHDSMGKVQLPGNAGTVDVIAGEYAGVRGTASTFTPIHLYNLRLVRGGKVDFAFPSDYNTALLIIEGSVRVNGQEAPADHFVLMANDGEQFTVDASEDAVVLVMSGQPIHEPVAAKGPFVMNTYEEIVQAFDDYNQGKFGHLDD